MIDERWVRVVATVLAADAELVADELWQAGAAGVEEQASGDEVRLLAGFASGAAASDAARALARRGVDGHLEAVVDDGLDGWRAHARAERAGPFWLVPTWVASPAAADPTWVLRLDPGRTFGSGSHPTTRLVVAQLAGLVRPGDRVLDVGAGSGVLAVAAARLGARAVAAIDIDPASPAVVGANADANGVGDRVHASTETVAEVVARTGPADVVAANLLAPVLRQLGPELASAVAPGGHLVVSGLLADRWADGVTPLAGLQVATVAEEEGWASVVLVRPRAAHR
ncbi:MAG: 50S ribosomal protein L11 methyltransferase [Acidimicrobiales bacterium]|mgnify:CR=1 FL=1|nr:50S ribosomal protein L11 methyltransferase [Acidimicrobiales bacterium]HRW36269.1 50S ribosomal protein L11 methyltransferase [Aquihabitans sp.]